MKKLVKLVCFCFSATSWASNPRKLPPPPKTQPQQAQPGQPQKTLSPLENAILIIQNQILLKSPSKEFSAAITNLKTILTNYTKNFTNQKDAQELKKIPEFESGIKTLISSLEKLIEYLEKNCNYQENTLTLLDQITPDMKNLLIAWDQNDFLRSNESGQQGIPYKIRFGNLYKKAYERLLLTSFLNSSGSADLQSKIKELTPDMTSHEFKNLIEKPDYGKIQQAQNEFKSLKTTLPADYFKKYCEVKKEYEAGLWKENKAYRSSLDQNEKDEPYEDLFQDVKGTILTSYIDLLLKPLYGKNIKKVSQAISTLTRAPDIFSVVNKALKDATTKGYEEEPEMIALFQEGIFKSDEDFITDFNTISKKLENASPEVKAILKELPEKRRLIRSLTLGIKEINDMATEYAREFKNLKQQGQNIFQTPEAIKKINDLIEKLKKTIEDKVTLLNEQKKDVPNLGGALRLHEMQLEALSTALDYYNLNFSTSITLPSPQDQQHIELVAAYKDAAKKLNEILQDKEKKLNFLTYLQDTKKAGLKAVPYITLEDTIKKLNDPKSQTILKQILTWTGKEKSLIEIYNELTQEATSKPTRPPLQPPSAPQTPGKKPEYPPLPPRQDSSQPGQLQKNLAVLSIELSQLGNALTKSIKK